MDTESKAKSMSIDEAMELMQTSMPLRKIKSVIDKTDFSADIKALLYDFSKVTLKVGEIVVAVGRRILSLAIGLVKTIPNITLGVLVALVISTLLATVPGVGILLSVAFTKLLLLLGITAGAIEDIRQNAAKDAMDRFHAQFAPLSGVEIQ